MTGPASPRLARWLLGRALPADVRDDITGDLEEMFARRRASHGSANAALWYWQQAVQFIIHFVAERGRDWWRHRDMATGVSWIDFRLAVRMLVRYPGLTIVAVLGMAVAIAIAAAAFTIADSLLNPSLPLPGGDRIVAIQDWNIQTNNREPRALHGYLTWRDGLTSVQDIGAFRNVGRNLIAPGSQPETVTVSEISASGFRVAGVSPALGRYLLPDDERQGAADVVVISHSVWQRRFAADPGILRRQIQLGAATYTIVGVMPTDFAFPLHDHYWTPLRVPAAAAPLAGPPLHVFARLAPGVTLEMARAELEAIGQRTTAAYPQTHAHIRPRITPFTHAFTDMDDPQNALALHATQTLIVLMLVLICVNVAILVYARTATRQGEIAVRTALGASRRRIVGQLFLEALVLSGAAAVAGVGLASFGLSQLDAAVARLQYSLPFWIDFSLSARSLIYVVSLTFLSGAIVGVIPALKATGRRVQSRLQGLSAGSGSRMQMGRMWTMLIVAQVAVAVAILPATTYHAWDSLTHRLGEAGYAADEFLTSQLVLDRGRDLAPADRSERDLRARYAASQSALERALEEDPSVAAVTFSLTNPGEEVAAVLEIEGLPLPLDPVNYNIVEGTKQGYLVRLNRVAPDFFPAFDVALLTGRGFGPADIEATADSVLVNRTFVEALLGGGNPLGRRVRYVGRSREAGAGNVQIGRWYEVVGVVPDFPPYASSGEGPIGRLYHAAAPGTLHPTAMAMRIRGPAPLEFGQRLREITATVDPDLQVRGLSTAEDAAKSEQGVMRLIGLTLVGITLSVIVLSAAGIYSLMSFTVARRRKEIGIRAALGADPARILSGIFARAVVQLSAGAAIGMLGAIGLERLLDGEMFQGNGRIVLPAVALLTTLVGLLAALGPARRGLRIQPTEALREE